MMWFAKVLLIITTFFCSARLQTLSATLSNSVINSNSIYTFNIIDNDLSTKNGSILLGFPSQLYSISSPSCYNYYNTSITFPCTAVNSSFVRVTYTIPTMASSFISLSVSTIKNPSSKQSVNITYVFTNSTTALPVAYSLMNSLTADILTSCSILFSPNTAFTSSSATFTITTKNNLDIGGKINLVFPQSWTNSVTGFSTPFLNTPTCSKVSGAPLANTLPCTFFPSFQSIILQPALSSAISTPTTLSFSVSGLRSPPTTNPTNSIRITTSLSNSNQVDSSACLVTPTTTKIVSLSTTSVFTVGVNGDMILKWVNTVPYMVGDVILLNVPANYITFNTTNGYLISGSTLVNTNTVQVSTTQISITITSISGQIDAGNSMTLGNYIVTCWVDVSARSISFAVNRGGYGMQSGTISINPIVNALTNVGVSGNNPIVSSPVTFTITFRTTNVLASLSSFRIQFPASSIIPLTGTAPACALSSSNAPSSVLASPSCTLSASLLTVPLFLTATIPINTVLTLTISNSFTNPLTSEPTTSFIITTYSQGGYAVDQSSSVGYQAQMGTIGNIAIVPGSFIVAQQMIYELTYTLTRTIKSGAVIIVGIPVQISIGVSASYSYSIDSSAYIGITPTLSSNTTYSNLTFNGIVNSQLSPNSIIKIRFNKLINPLSMRPSNSFSIWTTYNNYGIQYITTGLSITMSTPTPFKQLKAIVSNPTNGATQDYTFYFKLSVALSIGDIIRLEIIPISTNNQLSFISTITSCPIYYSSTQIINTCSLSLNTLTVTVTQPLIDTTGTIQYRLVASSIILSRTPALTSNFKLSTFSANYGVHSQLVNSMTNTIPNKIKSLGLGFGTTSRLNSYQAIATTVQTFNGLDLLNGQYLVLTIPSIFTRSNLTVASICTSSSYTCSIYNSDPNRIKVEKSPTFSTTGLLTTFTFTIHQDMYVSPQGYNYDSAYFYLDTYTTSGLKIDTTDPINVVASAAIFVRSCGAKCFSCLSSNKQNCTACYNASFGVILPNDYGNYRILNPNNQCVDVCGDGFYIDGANNCVSCVTPCQTCTAIDRCSSCSSGYYYLSTAIVTQRCKSQCPARFFPSNLNQTCTSCSVNCYNCSGTSTTCLSCTSGSSLFLQNGVCVSSCASGFYQDVNTNKCLACDAGCSGGCDVNASDCYGCRVGYFKPNSSSTQCVNSCPDGSVQNVITGVCGCSSGCLACTGSLSNCTSCNITAVLYNSNCLTGCPSQTYQLLSTCRPCVDTRCSNCTSTSCSLCSSNYYLYSGTCLSSCPSGTRIDNYQCVLCPTGCRSCLTNGCTQCFSGYLVQSNQCVSNCGAGYINFNATSCLSQCPAGYTNISNKCQSNTSEQVVTVTQIGRIIPFPYTIAYILVLAVSIGMRCLYQKTLLASVLMSLGCIVEVMAVLTLVIVGSVEKGGADSGLILVIIGIAINYICNVVALVLVYKVLSTDNKFANLYKKTVIPCITIRVLSTIFSHKFHQISFSNIFGVRAFSMKIENINKLYPFNILLIISLFISVFIVIGAGITSYSVQNLRLGSSTFIQSVDCILAVVFNMIPTVLVLRRQPNLYQNQVGEQAKRYETNDQLDINNESGGMDQFFIDQSRILGSKVSNTGQKRKNNFFRTGEKENGEDPYETPLDKKMISGIKPISTVAKRDPEQSSQALCFGDKNKNKIGRSSEEIDEDDIEEIQLEEPVGDNQGNAGFNKKKKQNISDNTDKSFLLGYTGYDLNPALLALPENSEEFKKLPSQTKAKIRLAKANMQINKNTQNMKKDTLDVEQIQLSPKKNKDDKRDSISDGNSSQNLLNESLKKVNQSEGDGNFGRNKKNGSNETGKDNLNDGSNGNNVNENGSLLIQGNQNQNGNDKNKGNKRNGKDDEKNRSISKSKQKQGKSKQKSLSKSRSLDKVQGITQSRQSQNVFDSNKQSKQQQNNANQLDEERFLRNRSEQMNKKLGKQQNIKATKSQNLKKKKGKLVVGDDSNLPMNKNGQNQSESENENDNNNSEDGDFEQDQPTLPIFKHKSKEVLERKGQSDGLERIGQENNKNNKNKSKSKGKNKNKQKGEVDHRSVDLNDHSNMNNLRNQKGNKTIPNQQPDDLPHMHSSEQLNKLIVINKRNNPRSSREIDFSNDDSIIYNKIYNDQTETLKSVQGDNVFQHDISPSQFNIQNQRFSQVETENDLPVPATIEIDSNGDQINRENVQIDDGEMEVGSRIQRYSSSNRIDYDSVLSKRVNNDRIKQLEKIYLPRLEVTKPGRKKK